MLKRQKRYGKLKHKENNGNKNLAFYIRSDILN